MFYYLVYKAYTIVKDINIFIKNLVCLNNKALEHRIKK
jgi:hypothetical protein